MLNYRLLDLSQNKRKMSRSMDIKRKEVVNVSMPFVLQRVVFEMISFCRTLLAFFSSKHQHADERGGA
jgi:hypothetical protein